jgi:PleD family two-component response regulator
MPVMNGLELAATIRKIPGHEKTPLIFVTENTSQEAVMDAIKVGANDFIPKPANHGELFSKVRMYLG